MEEIKQIVDLLLDLLRHRLAERHIELELTEAAKEHIAREGYDPVYGARPLKRAIQRYVENPLSMEILKGSIKDGDTVTLDATGDGIGFSVQAG